MYEFGLSDEERKLVIAMLNVAAPGGMTIDEMDFRINAITVISQTRTGPYIMDAPAYERMLAALAAFRYNAVNIEARQMVRRLQALQPKLELVADQEGSG